MQSVKLITSLNHLFSLVFALIRRKQGKLFNYHPQPYPRALRKSVSPLWWHGHKHSLWYLHQSVPEVPVHLSGLSRLITGCSYRCALAGGSENFQVLLFVSVSAGIYWRELWLPRRNRPAVSTQRTVLHNLPVSPPYFAKNTNHNVFLLFLPFSGSNCGMYRMMWYNVFVVV